MAYPKANNFSTIDNLGLNDTLGIQFTGRSADPADSDLAEGRLYYKTSVGLRWYNGSSWATLGASGGGTPSWETIYTNDSTFAITSGTWTITQSSANPILTLNKTNVSTGAVIDIANSGSGQDISGNGGYWKVKTSATHGVLELGSTGSINVTDGALSIGKTGTATTLLGTATIAEALTVTSGGATITSGTLTVTSGSFLISAGQESIISTSNTVATSLITNNTISTFGVGGASTGMVIFRSTSLTTGDLLKLQLTEATLTSGNYLNCYGAAGASVFSIAKTGVTTIAGIAGSNSLTLTAGDVVLSDASVTITDADNAATFTVTNDTATTASVVVIAGAGAFTGNTTSSFMTLTPSGLTTGTGLYMPLAALTTGKAINIVGAVATDAVFLTITGNTAAQTTTSKMIHLDLVANVAAQGLKVVTTGVYTGTAGLVDLDVGAMTTGVMLALTSTTGLTSGSLIRATTSTAGAIATNGAYAFDGSGNFTVGAVGLGMHHISAAATAAGTIASIAGGALTTGVALHVADAGVVMTSGSLIRVASATTGAVATNGIVSIRATGAYTSTSNVGLLDVSASATTAGTVVHITSTAAAQTTAQLLNVTASGYTTGYTGDVVSFVGASTTGAGNVFNVTAVNTTAGGAINVSNNVLTTGYGQRITHTTTVIADGGSLFRVSSTSVDTAATTGSLVDLSSTAATAANLVLISDGALLTGTAINVNHTAGVLASGGSLLRLTSGSIDTGTTTGTMLDIAATAATTANLALITSATLTTGVGIKMTLNGLTTGHGISINSSSTDTGARGLVHLSQTGAGATGTSMVRMTQVVTSTNYRKIFTETGSGITLWWGNGTTANALLAATTGDIILNAGSNKPEYCTNGGGALWTALV